MQTFYQHTYETRPVNHAVDIAGWEDNPLLGNTYIKREWDNKTCNGLLINLKSQASHRWTEIKTQSRDFLVDGCKLACIEGHRIDHVCGKARDTMDIWTCRLWENKKLRRGNRCIK